jgi:hypothetical protein
MVTDPLNNYFRTTGDKISSDNAKVVHIIQSDTEKHLHYLPSKFMTPFPQIKLNYIFNIETEKIIES